MPVPVIISMSINNMKTTKPIYKTISVSNFLEDKCKGKLFKTKLATELVEVHFLKILQFVKKMFGRTL